MSELIFEFSTEISATDIPNSLNNPFDSDIPPIAKVAAIECQKYIAEVSKDWDYDFSVQRGKMFGVLVVQKTDNTYGFLAAVSGKLPGKNKTSKFVPSIFDDSTDDFFINKGMTELSELGRQIEKASTQKEKDALADQRKQLSIAIQKQLFENYRFVNTQGVERSVIEIFESSLHGNPPSAAGECAAPKLIQYAFKNQLRPIAIAEFWWGEQAQNPNKTHQAFYPACKDKCRPILEFMLDDSELYSQVNSC